MEVISTRKYDATSSSKALAAAKPISTTTTPNIVTHFSDMFIQNPENSTAKVIEEEWETRKKKEITTTRQIETRIKRQVVLEDGEVIKDSGPFVTTNTTEDIEQQEQTTQEKRTIANDDNSLKRRREGSISPSVSANLNGKITVTSDKITSDSAGGSIIQKELNETIVKSREEVEELVETEKRQHLGDITDEAYQLAIIRNNNNTRKNLRKTLAETVNQLSSEHIEPRVIQHTTKSNKVIDTEKKIKRTGLKPDGAIVTETKTSVTHEEINDVPDYSYSENNGNDDNDEIPREIKKESSQKFFKQRDEDVVDYLLNGEKIARERRFISEITEGERVGDFDENIRTTLNRKNVLTKKPLSLDEEDQVKKFETSKWLENHFGSDHGLSSHSSKDEIVTNNHNDNNRQVQVQTMNNKSFINVTMKSSKSQDRKNNGKHKDTFINTYIDQSYSEHDQPVRLSNKQIKSERISNWSERHQQHNTTDKPNVNGNSPSSLLSLSSSSTTTSSYCIIETPQINGGDKEQIEQQENLPPQQMKSKKIFEDSSYIRTSSASSTPRYYTDTTKKHKQLQRNTSNSSSSLLQQRCHCQNSNKNHQQISVTNKCKCETDDLNLSSPSPQLPPHSSSVQVIQRTRDNRNKKVYHHPPPQQHRQYHYHSQFDGLQTSDSMNNSPQQRFCCHRRRNRDRRCRSSSPPSLIRFSSTPTLIKREKKFSSSDAHKNSSTNTSTSSKSKIGESFRRFVNKLRSASTERKNKKSSVNGGDSGGNSGNSNLSNTTSVSQVTQTDNTKNSMATYLQYNVIDKNIPDTQYHYNQTGDDIHEAFNNTNSESKSLQEKSSKNGSSVISNSAPGITKTIKVTRSNGHIANYDQYGRNNSITPVHRYYIKESFVGGRQNTERDAGYKNKSATKSRKPIAPLPPSSVINNDDNNNNNNNNNMNNDDETSDRYICKNNNNNIKYNQTLSRSNNEPSTFLGRFSKSASRLMTSTATTNEYDQKDRQVTSTQTLPRKLQRYLLVRNNNNNNSSSLTKKKSGKPPMGTSTNQFSSSHNHLNYIKCSSSSSPSPTQSFAPLSSMSPSNKSMHYGSMINISIKHNAPPPTIRENTPPKMGVVNNTGTLPVKPDRSYKSSLSRSKSFNVLEDNTVAYNNKSLNARNYSPRITYKSNTQLHRLDETPTPLKSPSILASINRYGGAGDNANTNKNL